MTELETWKRIAKDLAWALRRTPYYECGELSHTGGLFHDHKVQCPVVAMIEKTLLEYDTLAAQK